MGYEDRDYFQSRPKFEFSSALRPATKGLLIAVVAAYLTALIIGNASEFTNPMFFASGEAGAIWVRRLVVLTPADLWVWTDGFSPGHWKLLTHWLVPVGILTAVVDGVMLYIVGRMLEELFGTRRYLLLFVAACVLSGLAASLVDPLLMGGRTSVIMGPAGGIVAGLMSFAWIAPNQRGMFGFKIRPMVFTLVGVFAGLALVTGILGEGEFNASPTRLIWAAAISAAYMSWLQARGRVPTPATGSYEEAWSRRGNLPEEVDAIARSIAEARKEDERLRRAEDKRRAEADADQKRLDAILEKISREGITALSRSEKSFLDDQSRKRKP